MSLKESDRPVDPNIIHLTQSNYLKEVNNELTTISSESLSV